MKSAILHWPRRPFHHAAHGPPPPCRTGEAFHPRNFSFLRRSAEAFSIRPSRHISCLRRCAEAFSIHPSHHISFPRRCGGSAEHSEAIGAPLAHSTFSRQKITNRPRRPFHHAAHGPPPPCHTGEAFHPRYDDRGTPSVLRKQIQHRLNRRECPCSR